ncbi:Hypothetical predicted protein, partial [Lynx pardinus]
RVSPSIGQMSHGRMSVAPTYTHWTLLLPVPRDCGHLPACPRKSSQDSVAAVSQGLWKIITHNLAPVFTLNDLAPGPVNVATFRGLLGLGGFNNLYQMSFKQWNRFSLCGPENRPDPTLFLGIHPSHQSTA